jgi:ABC-type glutathione transport system ATPase component
VIDRDPDDAVPAPRLVVRDLRVRVPGAGAAAADAEIVRGAAFDVAAGETLAVVGASGSGKTTAARAIMRLMPATGTVQLDGVDLLAARGRELHRQRRRMQMVWQDPAGSLDPRMRIGDQVAEPLLVHGLARGAAARRRAAELLERCGLPAGSPDRRPAAFSGGQQQRIAIARAIILEPSLLVCDEPTSALDAHVRGAILDLLAELQAERGLSMLMITHDLEVVRRVAGRTAVMDAGTVVERGPTAAIIGAPQHPATQALVAAIPVRHPREADARRRALSDAATAGGPGTSTGT